MSQTTSGQVSNPKQDAWVKAVLGLDTGGAGAPGAGPGNFDDLGKLAGKGAGRAIGAEMGKKIGAMAGKKPAFDEAAYDLAVANLEWGKVAEMLHTLKAPALKKRMTEFSAKDMDALYTAACDDPKVGKKSAVALFVQTLAHPVLGSMQSGRAADLEKKLSKKDKQKYDTLMAGAKSKPEKDYITKGLASGHSVAELEKFATKIAGKSPEWLQDNLSLTGATDGSGVKQQWHDSCGPTTFEAVRGELDPIYALKMHEKNFDVSQVNEKDATDLNEKLAADQKKILKKGGGIAVDRDKGGGSGMWIADPLNKVSGSTGLKYDLKKIPDDGTVDDGLNVLKEAAGKGEPVPISIGNGAGNFQHYVLVTASDPGPPRYFTIHDPWDGKTVIRTEEQMKKGEINIAGCNDLESWDKPHEVPVKKKRKKGK